MKTSVLLVAILMLGVVKASSVDDVEQKRLIALSDDHRQWMTQKEINELMLNRTGFMDVTDYVNSTSFFAIPAADPLPNQPQQKALVQELIKSLSQASMKSFITSLSNFTTRYYKSNTGALAAVWIQNQFQSMAEAAGRTDVTVNLFPHNFVQSSVIAIIPGRGPNSDEVVVIGGHEDSIVSSVTGRSPGADDDASGSSTVLEVFRVLVGSNFIPDRSIAFMTYAGEEAGLLGSQAIATSYAQLSSNVYGVLQLDMTGYGNGPLGLITDYTDSGLTNFLSLMVDTYSNLEWTTTKCGYGCSDHASWTKVGYRSCIPFETTFDQSNPYIHTSSDLLSKISLTRMHEVSKVALGFVVEMAGRTMG